MDVSGENLNRMEFDGSRVLVIDDDPAYLNLVRSMLERRSYVVETMSDPGQLSSIIEFFQPQTILIDMNIGNTGGIDLLPQIRSLAPDAGVLVISSTKTPELVFHALFEGATDFLEKPLLAPEVDLRIRSILKKHALRNRMRETNSALEKEKRILLRHFSPQIAEEILSGRTDAKLNGASMEVTSMFFGIKQSGKILGSMAASEFAEFLNQSLMDVMDLVEESRGSVNKITGAGLLATFGLPFPSPEDARNGVSCAVRIRDHFRMLNEAGIYEFGKIKIGIGITSGQVFAGNIGSFRRMEYAVIGDSVNIAARLETLAGGSRGEILMDEATLALCGISDAKKIQEKTIRGRKEEVSIFSL